jgi:hypothetical protein
MLASANPLRKRLFFEEGELQRALLAPGRSRGLALLLRRKGTKRSYKELYNKNKAVKFNTLESKSTTTFCSSLYVVQRIRRKAILRRRKELCR